MGGSGRISPTSAIAVPTDFPNSVRGGRTSTTTYTSNLYILLHFTWPLLLLRYLGSGQS